MLAFIVASSLILALLITFLNGMNDAADAVSCIITTRVLTPLKAVVWAAFWGFMAYFIFNSHVAETMSSGLVEAQYMNPYVVFCALVGATAWIGICTWLGLPISSSQALIGGIIGPVLFSKGSSALVLDGVFLVLLFMILTPVIGIRFFLAMSNHENMQEFEQEKGRYDIQEIAAVFIGSIQPRPRC